MVLVVKKTLLAICCIAMGAIYANAAVAKCGERTYLESDGTCATCTAGYYCPGDDMRHECPAFSGRARTSFPAEYYDAKIELNTSYIAPYASVGPISGCTAATWMTNSRGRLYEYVYYNPDTDKYDITRFFDWSDTYAGYYLNGPTRCGSYAYYLENKVCEAGGYCPGKSHVSCNSSNQATVHTQTFGLEVCGDNSYSDAGASSCTPCPAGTGNSGSNLSDHAGVSSCKTISCPAGQEVVNYTCTACKAGYYKASAGSASCTQCTDYKYASGTGNTSCTLPPAGYNSTGCSSGKGCTGQEPCGTSWYCPGDGRYYSCPSNSTARTNTSTSADDCLCNSGYVKRSGECKQLCTAGFTTLNSNGVTVNAYAEKLTTPSINISANGKTCYVPLASGSASGAINVSYDSKTYHTVN